jgi:hypothetical protein
VEVHEGDDVAIRPRQRLLIARQDPLHGVGPQSKEATSDKDLRTIPWLH